MKPIVVFDIECPLCVRFKQSLMYLDKSNIFEFRPLQDETLFVEFPILDKNECEKEIHVIINKSEYLKGINAIEYILRNYPQAKKFSWLVESNSGKKTMNYFYNKLNEIRGSSKKSCPKCNKK